MKNQILCVNQIVPKSICEEIINFFELSENKEPGLVGNATYDPQVKKCTEIHCYFEEDNFTDKILPFLTESISIYKNQYPLLNALNFWNIDREHKIQKYTPGEAFYHLHCENFGEPTTIKRVLAWMIYLNNVDDGGETEFPDQKVNISPTCGTVVLWPAFFTHPHRGNPSSETKYIITGWCSHLI
jgi:hypothetical protein